MLPVRAAGIQRPTGPGLTLDQEVPMYVRSIAAGCVAAIALNLPAFLAPRFHLDTTGAVQLDAVGHEARYGIIAVDGASVLTVSLGATGSNSALQLRLPSADLPRPGRYPIRSSWDDTATAPAFQAFLAAGSPEQPLGWFHGESGTVTITRSDNGMLSGSFEILARGYLAGEKIEAESWVTVKGSFEAEGDSTATTIARAK
ncbi:MAG: hypothetical protein ACJ8AM_05445 [Gemmatimonadales bacterium]